MTLKTKQQVLDQYRVVAHLAKQLSIVHEQSAEHWALAPLDEMMIDMLGQRSASIMEELGDILNGMDAVDPAQDGWCDPIFHAAQNAWPQAQQGDPQ